MDNMSTVTGFSVSRKSYSVMYKSLAIFVDLTIVDYDL